jgi:all-trans-retinol 13,14-reductase
MAAVSEGFDAVVVGAGPGGLTAASLLAAEGMRVLVLERNESPGGTARGYVRHGFTFPCGPLSFSNPGMVADALAASGAQDPEMEFLPARYRLCAMGTDVILSAPTERLSGVLSRMFPAEAAGIRAFFEDAGVLVSALGRTPEGEAPALGDRGTGSAADHLGGLVADRSLTRLLGSVGTGEPRFGFPMLACMWDFMCARGIWYPAGGFDSLASRAAAAIEGRGGEVKLGSEVEAVVVSGGAIRGVRLRGGTSVESPVVISNADFKTTFLRLVDAGAQPPEWRQAVLDAPETSSNLQVALGLERSKVDLSAFSDASRIIYRSEFPAVDGPAGPAWDEQEIDPGALARQELEVCLWSADDPSLAPPGGATLVIRVAADHAHFSRFRPGPGRRLPSYGPYKARLAGALVQEVSRLVPGLEEAAAVVDVATPLTFQELGGRFAGAVAGWSQLHEDVRDYTLRPLVLTPVKGLYMAGHQAFSWLRRGGVPTAVASGARAAAAALLGDGPVTETWLP